MISSINAQSWQTAVIVQAKVQPDAEAPCDLIIIMSWQMANLRYHLSIRPGERHEAYLLTHVHTHRHIFHTQFSRSHHYKRIPCHCHTWGRSFVTRVAVDGNKYGQSDYIACKSRTLQPLKSNVLNGIFQYVKFSDIFPWQSNTSFPL